MGPVIRRWKALGACAAGIFLAVFYAYLGTQTFSEEELDLGAYFLSVFLYVPGIFFLLWGGKDEADRYREALDDKLFGFLLILLTADILLLILKIIFRIGWLHYLHWLPDLTFNLAVAFACLRRAYLWTKLVASVPPPPSPYSQGTPWPFDKKEH